MKLVRQCVLLVAGSAAAWMPTAAWSQPPAVMRPRKGPVRPPRGLTMVERLNRMSPEERQRTLDKLPPERRTQLEQALERYQKLSPDQRNRLSQQFRGFQQLPPEQRDGIRQAFKQLSTLSPDRRRAVRREVGELRTLTIEERQERLDSDETKQHFSADERAILSKLAVLPDID